MSHQHEMVVGYDAGSQQLHRNAEGVVVGVGCLSQLVARLSGMLLLPTNLPGSTNDGGIDAGGKNNNTNASKTPSLLDPTVMHRLRKDYSPEGESIENVVAAMRTACDRLLDSAIPLAVQGAHAGQMWTSTSKRLEEGGRLLSQASTSVEWLSDTRKELQAQVSALDKQVCDQQRAFTQWAVRGANKTSVDSISGCLWYRSDLQDLRVQGGSSKTQDGGQQSVEWRAVLEQMQRSSNILRAERDELTVRLERLRSKAPPDAPPALIELERRTEELAQSKMRVAELERSQEVFSMDADQRRIRLEAQVAERDEEIAALRMQLSTRVGTSSCVVASRPSHTLVASLHMFTQHSLGHRYLSAWRAFTVQRQATKTATLQFLSARSADIEGRAMKDVGGGEEPVDNSWEVAELLVRLGRQHSMLIALEDERDALAAENSELRSDPHTAAAIGGSTTSFPRSRGSTPHIRQLTPTRAQSKSGGRKPPLANHRTPVSRDNAISSPSELHSEDSTQTYVDAPETLSTLSANALRSLIADHPELFADEHSIMQRRGRSSSGAVSAGDDVRDRSSPANEVRPKRFTSAGLQQATLTQAEASAGGASAVMRLAASVGSVAPLEGRGAKHWVESLLRPSPAPGGRVRPMDVLAVIQQEAEQRHAAQKVGRTPTAIRHGAAPDAASKRKAMIQRQLELASKASLDNSGAILAAPIKSATGHQSLDEDVTALTIFPQTPQVGPDGHLYPSQEVTLEAVQVRSLKLYSVLQPLMKVIQRRLQITNCPLPPLPLYEATTKPIVTVVLQWAHSSLSRMLQLLSFDDRLTHCKFRLYFLSAKLRRRIRELEGDLSNVRMDRRARQALTQQVGEFKRIQRAVAAERAHINSLREQWKAADAGSTKERQEANTAQCQITMEAVETAAAGFTRQMEANVVTAYLLQAETTTPTEADEHSSLALVATEADRRIQARELRLVSGLKKQQSKHVSTRKPHVMRTRMSTAPAGSQTAGDPDVEGPSYRGGQLVVLPPLQSALHSPHPGDSSSLLSDLLSLKSEADANTWASLSPSSKSSINFHTRVAGGKLTPVQNAARQASKRTMTSAPIKEHHQQLMYTKKQPL